MREATVVVNSGRLEDERKWNADKNTEDETKGGQHSGNGGIFRRTFGRVHHAQTAQVTVRQAHDEHSDQVYVVVVKPDWIQVVFVIAQQKEWNQNQAGQHSKVQVLGGWSHAQGWQQIAQHGRQIESQVTGDGREIDDRQWQASPCGRRCRRSYVGQNGRKQQQSDEERDEDVETLKSNLTKHQTVGRTYCFDLVFAAGDHDAILVVLVDLLFFFLIGGFRLIINQTSVDGV